MERLRGILRRTQEFGHLLRSERAFGVGISLVAIGEYTALGTLGVGIARTIVTGGSLSTYNPPEAALVATIATGISGAGILASHAIARRVNPNQHSIAA